jgi:hypothetical protein
VTLGHVDWERVSKLSLIRASISGIGVTREFIGLCFTDCSGYHYWFNAIEKLWPGQQNMQGNLHFTTLRFC